MKIVVLGAGVIGVSTAWYLAKAGHQVVVVDRQEAVALETSFANAGMISPSYSSPWAAPGIPLKAIGWMLQDLAPLKINFKYMDLQTITWMMKMLANCRYAPYQVNKERLLRLSHYSRQCFIELRKELGIQYDARQLGTLQLFRKQSQLKTIEKDIEVLKQLGIKHQLLDVQGCIDYESGLIHSKDKIVGGLHLPDDETGDCFKFTQNLAKQCEKIGVEFLFNQDVQSLNVVDGQIQSITANHSKITADAFVVSMGCYSKHILNTVGIDIPVYPIKGYSITAPIKDESLAPTSTVMDEIYKIAVTRFDDRIRVGGTAEITSYNLDKTERGRKNLEFVLNDLFAGAACLDQIEFWTGLRPMTPDSTPIVGATKFDNLYINSGHGTLGWTMSLGSAKLLSDIIDKKSPDIDPEGLSIDRY